MSDTFEKIVEAIAPSLAGKKRKAPARRAASSGHDKTLAAIKKNLGKLAKDVEKLAKMVAEGSPKSKKPPAKKTARKPAAKRKT